MEIVIGKNKYLDIYGKNRKFRRNRQLFIQ